MVKSEYDYFKEIKTTSRISVLIGKKGSGKTFMFNAMLKYFLNKNWFKEYHLVIPVYKLGEENDSYKFLKDKKIISNKKIYIYDKYDPVILQNLYEDKRKKERLCFMVDDATGGLSKKFYDADVLIHLFTTSRHLNINTIICLHTMNSILKPVLRANIDYVFIYALSDVKLLNILYDEFLSLDFKALDKSFKDFLKIYKEKVKTIKYSGMIINTIEDNIDYNIYDWDVLKLNKI